MANRDYVFTSESVSEGHPDKICDRISDAIVDTYLAAEREARCGVETLVTTNRVILAGEVRGPASITNEKLIEVARDAIREIGYEQENFHWRSAAIKCLIHGQSSDIAQGVDASGNKDEGAGDQGMMFGYACHETSEFMPAPIFYAHAVLRSLSEARHAGKTPLLGPDAKSQVTLQYIDGKPVRAAKIVVSIQHSDRVETDEVRDIVRPYVVATLPEGWMCDEENFLVNPTGRFVIGGPDGDAGLTGRKIIVDTYGGAAPHGGGAFSGKDPTKVDRSAAYAARYVAKNVVAAGLADRCQLQVAYAIGVAHPMSVLVKTFGTENVPVATIERLVREHFDLRPAAILRDLELRRPIFSKTAAYGHFGREDRDFTWERTDKADALREAAGLSRNEAEREHLHA